MKRAALLAGALAPPSALAATMMRVAWLHNAQGEIHEGGIIHWGYWVGIGASWFVLLAIPCGILAFLLHRSSN